jgi:hypothetical protein
VRTNTRNRADEGDDASPGKGGRVRALVIAVLAAHIVGTVVARRRGYRMGASIVVRCRQGHLFMTIWVPGATVKALRLGWWRYQRCPVGRHWSLVTPVRESELTEEELAGAREYRDIRIP